MTGAKIDFENSVENDLLNCETVKDILDKYQILDKIHQNSISQIFVLRDYNTKELLILKAINKDTEFIWDLEAIKKIRHPQIARVIDVQTTDRYIYILKEYIKGVTLEQYAGKMGSISEENVLNIGLALCEIIGYFHSIKPFPIIYRDLKPANLILTEDGSVRLIDLDSVRQYKENSPKDTFYIGTEGFAAPEQFGFSQTDHRTDIYTLGTTLYYLLAGKKPESDKFRLKSVKRVRSDVSDAMCEIIEKCTSFNPESRYQSVNELRNDLLELHKKDVFSFAKQKVKRLFRQTNIKAVEVMLLIAIATTGYFFSVDNNKKVPNMTQESASLESNTDLIISVSNDVFVERKQEATEEVSFSFDKTTINEAFWSGDVPKTLPKEFVEYYKQQYAYKYDPNLFFIAIKEWDFTQDHSQMKQRLIEVGSRLLLKAEGHKDIEAEMNGRTMTAGDGLSQLYAVKVINTEDMVSGVKYRIIDETGHWIVNEDVYVERP